MCSSTVKMLRRAARFQAAMVGMLKQPAAVPAKPGRSEVKGETGMEPDDLNMQRRE